MSVTNALNTAVYNVLSGNAALTTLLGGTAVYYQQAPDHANLPYVVFSHQAGQPDNTHGNDDRSQIVYVRGYSGTATQAGSIDLHCGTTLHRRALTVAGYTNFWTTRETELNLV
jgi:hypothetical protein